MGKRRVIMDTFWINVMMSIISGIVSGLLVWLVTIWVNEKITRPDLTFHDSWKMKKTVYRYANRKRMLTVPNPVYSNGLLTTSPYTEIETNIDETVEAGKGDYEFYGITIKNKDDPNAFIHRRVAEVTRTTLLMDDGQKIECRWWTRDYSELDKLFAGEQANIDDRRKTNISSGTSEHLVIAYHIPKEPKYCLFTIDSDVKDNFWKTSPNITQFPRYAKLFIYTATNMTEIKLEISLKNNQDNELSIKEITSIPKTIQFG
jgi:hypothetical protein